MVKRQASQHHPLGVGLGIAMIIFSTIMLALSACSTPVTADLTQTLNPTSSSTSTKSPTADTPEPATPILQPTSQPTSQPPSSTPTSDCLSQGGHLQSASFTSQILGETLSYQVYLPPCYFSSPEPTGYPVIYLLHGLLSDYGQWIRIGVVEAMDALIAEGAVSPAIIVLPQEINMEPPQTSRYDDVIIEELIPWIDSVYDTRPEKTFRAIGGVSRGAGWAVRIGFEHPNLFSRIGAHSLPLFEADGGKVIAWMTQTPKEEIPAVFIDIGRDDAEWQTAQSFANQLDEFNLPHEWYLFTGGHTEAYWSSHLLQYLDWYTRNW